MNVFSNLFSRAKNSCVVNAELKPQTHQTVVDGKVVNQIVVFNTPKCQHVIINTGGSLSAMVSKDTGAVMTLDRITELELQTILLNAANEFTQADTGSDYYALMQMFNAWAVI